MNKKGQVELVIGGIALVVVLVVGGIQSHTLLSENKYVFDESTNTIYDLSKCSIKNLDQSNLVYISGVDEIGENYKLAKCGG